MLGIQDRFRICGYRIPHYFWFVLSGGLCDIIQAFIDYGISLIYYLEWEKATVCWTVSYILSIAVRHSSHRLLVFGEYEGTYWSSLFRTYATYSSSIVLSMVTNHLMVSFLGFSHQMAWIFTMIWTGIYNYFLLKTTWGGGNNNSNPQQKENQSASSSQENQPFLSV
jgi:putative flippase GtrA